MCIYIYIYIYICILRAEEGHEAGARLQPRAAARPRPLDYDIIKHRVINICLLLQLNVYDVVIMLSLTRITYVGYCCYCYQ